MQQILSSSVPQHVRRTQHSCQKVNALQKATGAGKDQRWHLLDLVRSCRNPLGLRDRDITVLRGLLTLLPASAEPEHWVVFASNRVLSERCDGIDERTLRRRILHLQSKGLLKRKLSPNGKRYQVRDEHAEARLTYGIDLSPLFLNESHLEALAESCKREELRKSALRSVIRDVLYHHAASVAPELCEQARLSLRRSLTSAQLQDLIETMRKSLPDHPEDDHVVSSQMTVSRSQNDRHILRSNKDTYESEYTQLKKLKLELRPEPTASEEERNDITIDECVELAPSATELSPSRPRTWTELIDLSFILAPAIGLSKPTIEAARVHLGAHGCALAVIGLVEAFGRIRNPQAYFNSLTKRAQEHGLNLVRMFRSLVKPQRVELRHS